LWWHTKQLHIQMDPKGHRFHNSTSINVHDSTFRSSADCRFPKLLRLLCVTSELSIGPPSYKQWNENDSYYCSAFAMHHLEDTFKAGVKLNIVNFLLQKWYICVWIRRHNFHSNTTNIETWVSLRQSDVWMLASRQLFKRII